MSDRHLQFVNLALLWLHARGVADDTVAGLLCTIPLVKAGCKRAATAGPPAPVKAATPLSALLSVPFTPKTLAPAVSVYMAWQRHCAGQAGTLSEVQAKRDQDERDLGALKAELQEAKSAVTALQSELEAKAQQARRSIAELQQHSNQHLDAYQHRLDETRARLRGVLSGRLRRHVYTALQALQEPPCLDVAKERLEDALKLVDQEAAWLTSSESTSAPPTA